MRALVVLLLLGNLVLFVLLQRGSEAPSSPPVAEGGTLRAVSNEAGLYGDCLVSQAFDRQVEAQLAMFRLEIPHTLQMRYRERSDGWRVHLPPTDSLEAARRQLRALREAGVDRPALVTDGEPSNTVSVGTRSEQADAEVLRSRVETMGFDVRVSPRTIRGPRHHLVLQATEPPEHLAHLGWTAEPCRDALR